MQMRTAFPLSAAPLEASTELHTATLQRWVVFVGMALLALVALAGSSGSAQTTATETVLYSFCAGGAECPFNAVPLNLVQASDGNFYGITQSGGDYGNGTFFKMTPSGAVTTLYSFCNQSGPNCPNGLYPEALVQGGDGNFYGVTRLGGANQSGSVFKVTPAGALTTLYSFCSQGGANCTDGAWPQDLAQGSDGNFYGTTAGNGVTGYGSGTIFKVTPGGTLTTLYTFCSQGGSTCPDGANPLVLVQGSDGDFYGTTASGGAGTYTYFTFNYDPVMPPGAGTLFKITPSGTLTTLYTFCQSGQVGNQCADGVVPNSLAEGADGNFYGTTQFGGSGSYNFIIGQNGTNLGGGTAFKITPFGNLTTLYSFCSANNCSDAGWPMALIAGSDGNFYGTALEGSGYSNLGTAFEITPSGTMTTLYNFASQLNTDSQGPDFLMQGSDGNLYGSASTGGTNLDGSIFKLTLSPVLPAPVQLSLSPTQIYLGQSATLSWKVLNAASTTMQQCYAYVQNSATGAGTWSGLQAGTMSNGVYSGNATITPTAVGTYTYALTCGGVESGYATLMVGGVQAIIQAMQASINTLLSQGVLTSGQANSLLKQLQQASNLIQAAKINGAIGVLNQFIAEVNDLLSSGVLSQYQAGELISGAQSLIANLST